MRTVLFTFGVLFACASTFAQTGPPAAADRVMSLPHDQHDGLTLSADPYTDSARAKDKLGKADPFPSGILPVEVFLRNDTDEPLQIDLSTVQLDATLRNGQRQSLDWLDPVDVATAVVHPDGPAPPTARRFPLGVLVPSKDKKVAKMAEELRPFILDAEIVPPKGEIHGFLFFDVSHDMSVADRASLYVPDVTVVATRKPLIFFEVPLGKTPAP